MDVKDLRGQREKLVADMRAVIDKADGEKRALTSDDQAKLAQMKADALRLRETITTLDELDAEERAIVPESQRQEPKTAEGRRVVEARRTALVNLAHGRATADDHATMRGSARADVYPSNPNAMVIGPELRAQNTLTGVAGGFSVAPDTSMYGRIISALKFYGGVEQSGATVLTTETGADLPIATDDDTSNVGAIVAEEASQASGTSVTMGQVVLHGYLYSSKIVKVSWQLLQDASFDIEGWLGAKLGMRLGRIQNTHFTTGTGTNQPQGLTTIATVGRQAATGNSTTVTADDVIKLIHSVDVAYRNANCKFMMSDLTAQAFELLKDGNGQYIWRAGGGLNGLNERTPDTLRGFPVVINNDMPALAASAKHTSFGDHSFYYIRRVRALQVVRLNELYVENGQVGFLAFLRADGGLVDAGQHPVKLMQNSAA